jgi:hypothetical protein
LVGGRRRTAALLAAVDFLAARFFAGFFLTVLVVPDETRVECFGRWRTLRGAASPTDPSRKTAINAKARLFRVARVMTSLYPVIAVDFTP